MQREVTNATMQVRVRVGSERILTTTRGWERQRWEPRGLSATSAGGGEVDSPGLGYMRRGLVRIIPCMRSDEVTTAMGQGCATATGRGDGVAPALAEGFGIAIYGQGSDLTCACRSQEGTRDRQRTGSWIDETLHEAMDKITDKGMKLKVAAKIFGIPSSSLRDHLYGRTTSR